jgi:hypothetical protein
VNTDRISDYEAGAAQSLAAQREAEAAGQAEAARVAAASVDANLDAINRIKGQG